MKAEIKAPKKLSDAMQMALADEMKAHKSPLHRVVMNDWHEPMIDGKCEVCFAGALMAFSLKHDVNETFQEMTFGDGWHGVFSALDDVRRGWVEMALQSMSISAYNMPYPIKKVTGYQVNREQWRKDMFKIVKDLEVKGL